MPPDEIDAGIMRRHVLEAPDSELLALDKQVREALTGSSNDAEHDALLRCAEVLGIEAFDRNNV